MDIQKLKYFCCVAKHLNFSRAAEECHIAQTAMSRNIASLENELGFRLFNRTHHYVELTPSGAYFLVEATKIVEAYEFAKQSGLEISKTSTTRLDIGFGGYDLKFAEFYIGKFMKEFPQCSIVLHEYHYDNLFESLLAEKSDVIFTPQTRIEGKNSIKQVVISDSNYTIGVGLCHPLSQYDEVTPEMLNGQNFICPSDINLSWNQKNHLSNIFNHYGITPGCITRTNSAMAVMVMLDLGMGVTFLSEDIKPINKNIKSIKIRYDNPATKRHVAAAMIPFNRPIIKQFLDFVESTPLKINASSYITKPL